MTMLTLTIPCNSEYRDWLKVAPDMTVVSVGRGKFKETVHLFVLTLVWSGNTTPEETVGKGTSPFLLMCHRKAVCIQEELCSVFIVGAGVQKLCHQVPRPIICLK